MATAPIYCTHKELKRVFPQLNEFDGKKQVYGFVKEKDDYDGTSDLWYASGTGLVTQLYIDGAEAPKITFPTTAKTALNGAYSDGGTAYAVDSTTGIEAGDIIKVDNHYSIVAVIADSTTMSINDSTLGVAAFNTLALDHANDSSVFLVVDQSEYDATSGYWFTYDSEMDMVILAVPDDINPNDLLIESGEDFTTLVTQYRTDASRYLDSRLDPNLPREQLKDKSGNFDYMIVRTTALIAASFMIKTNDPTSEMAASFMEEAEKNITDMNNGNAALSWQNTSDGSKGVIRDVTYTGTVRPVDTRGRYSGTYDLIKVKITTGGAIGTAKYSVWAKDGDKLGMNEGTQVITDEIVNGDYQSVAGGLQIRFAGTNFDSTAAANDVWEIEVSGFAEEVDSSSLKPIRMTRRWQ